MSDQRRRVDICFPYAARGHRVGRGRIPLRAAAKVVARIVRAVLLFAATAIPRRVAGISLDHQ